MIAPDGMTLAFSRSRSHFPKPTKHGISDRYYSSTTTWIVGLSGGRARRLTSWRNGLSYVPGSFSPAYVEVKADTSFDPGLGLLFPTGNAIEEIKRRRQLP